ncbi:MAG: hypothetical protein PHS24_02135 [Bacilli bacterium]|nr:hypothetical protein [Bacilli bacterium]
MKKNGFIATSLLYSFFLVFCALLLALVASYAHNRLLLNNLVNNTKLELSNINNRSASDLKVGDYLKMSLFSNERYINLKDKLWIVSSVDTDTVNLVSATALFATNKYGNVTTMQNELNLFYNLYTTGGEENHSYVTYLTKTQLDNFHNVTNEIIKKALLDNENEYIYYDDTKASPRFYLRKNPAGFPEFENALVAPRQYPIRLSVNISKNAPILGGKGLYLDPYTLVYYMLNDSLKLHYDYLNISGNKGLKTSTNLITDLSGTNPFGQSISNYANDLNTGITLIANNTINTNLNIYDILKTNKYTIEFRTNSYFALSTPSKMAGFIIHILDIAGTQLSLNIAGNIIPYLNDFKTFNTVSITRNEGNINIYINGELVTPSFSNIPIDLSDTLLYIGSSTNDDKSFKSLRVYNKALTINEIRNNYIVDTKWSK